MLIDASILKDKEIEIRGVRCTFRHSYDISQGVIHMTIAKPRYVWANKFARCNICRIYAGLRFETDEDYYKITDRIFIDFLRKQGWIIKIGKLMLCPSCTKKTKKELENV